MVVRRYVRLLRVLRGVLRFDRHLFVNARIEMRVRVQWGILMALVRIVGVWEQDSRLLLLLVVLDRLSWGDNIYHCALESLGLLRSLRWSLHLLLYDQMVILRLQRFNVCIRRQRQRCRSNVGLVILRGALRVYRQNLLLAPNLSTTTLSNVSLTVCIHRSKRVTLRLMPPDGRWNRAEQLSLGFRLDIHEPDVPGLKVVVGRGVVWSGVTIRPMAVVDAAVSGGAAGSEETM